MRLKAKTKDIFILSVFVVGHIGSAYHRVRITASPPWYLRTDAFFYNLQSHIETMPFPCFCMFLNTYRNIFIICSLRIIQFVHRHRFISISPCILKSTGRGVTHGIHERAWAVTPPWPPIIRRYFFYLGPFIWIVMPRPERSAGASRNRIVRPYVSLSVRLSVI